MCLSHDEFKRYKRQNDNCIYQYMIQNSHNTKGLSIAMSSNQKHKLQSENTFLTDKLLDDFESKRGLKECDPEYFVIPHPSIPPPVLLVKPP